MADKYIRHGATYCGDGTTSAAAASNGAAGAWNNINVYEGSSPAYGALAAGDRVTIRSKNEAGAAITRVLSANIALGSSAATTANRITWVIDGGTVWSGIDGIITYQIDSGTTFTIDFLANNETIAEVPNALLVNMLHYWPGYAIARVFGNVKHARFDLSAISASTYGVVISAQGIVLDTCSFKMGNSNGAPRLIIDHGCSCTLIDPDIEMAVSTSSSFVFGMNSYYGASTLEILYGRVYGVGANDQTCLVQASDSNIPFRVKVIGTQIPTAVRMVAVAGSIQKTAIFEAVGLDGGTGAYIQENWGWATSRTDNNPPVLSAQRPDSTLSLWAWRLYPFAASAAKPVRLPSAKFYTGDPAVKTLTLEFLAANTMSLSKANVWVTVNYIDNATGLPKSVTTLDFSAPVLDTSTASWNVTTWGVVTCNKKKIVVTTPTAIKKDTLVTVTFWSTKAAASANDIFFIDHDWAVT